MAQKKSTEKQLEELADTILLEDLPLDNNFTTDEEDDDDDNIDDEFENTLSQVPPVRPDKNQPILPSSPIPSTSAYNPGEMEGFPTMSPSHNPEDDVEADELVLFSTSPTPAVDEAELEENSEEESNVKTTPSRKSKRQGMKSKQKKVKTKQPKDAETEEAKRKWKKTVKDEYMPDYLYAEGPIEEEFSNCHTPTDVYLQLLGEVIEVVVYQSNLYATQKTKA